jgi:hypothetical protein
MQERTETLYRPFFAGEVVSESRSARVEDGMLGGVKGLGSDFGFNQYIG